MGSMFISICVEHPHISQIINLRSLDNHKTVRTAYPSKMNLQLLFFILTILNAIKFCPRALADYITSLSSIRGPPAWFYTYSTSSLARNQLFAQQCTNTSTNATKTTTTSTAKNVTATAIATKSSTASCLISMPTDQDLARKLQGLVVPMVIALILAILTIIVCEGMACKQRRVYRREAEEPRGDVQLQEL